MCDPEQKLQIVHIEHPRKHLSLTLVLPLHQPTPPKQHVDNTPSRVVHKHSPAVLEPIPAIPSIQQVVPRPVDALPHPPLLVQHRHETILAVGDIVAVLDILVVRAYGAGAIVVQEDAQPVLLEVLHRPHVDCVAVVAEVVALEGGRGAGSAVGEGALGGGPAGG